MLRWGRSGEPKVKEAEHGTAVLDRPVDSVDVQTVLDTLVEVFRAYGKFALDTESATADDTRESMQKWIKHLTMGAQHPVKEGEPGGKRDWQGASGWMVSRRRDEQQYVVKSLADLRQVIWAFVHSVHQAVVDDDQADKLATAQLRRLQVAVETSSTESLKREALSAVATISAALEERKSRQRSQVAELGAQLRALGKQLEEARRASALDPLTGLANRKAFDDFAARSIELHALMGQPATLLLIDVDHFKQVNDTYGHLVGDAVLRRLSDCLARTFLRRCDFVARFGGEEFVVILHETNMKDGRRLADRLMNSVKSLNFDEEAKGLGITLSIGVAEMKMGENCAMWVERADKVLYQAKQLGRDRVVEAPEN